MNMGQIKNGAETLRRSWSDRILVFLAGLSLISTSYSYCVFGSISLAILIAIATLLAIFVPRNLPITTRAVVWSIVTAVFVCMAANISRISGQAITEKAIFWSDMTPYERFATITLAIGISMLFFKLSNGSITIVLACQIPAIMLAAARATILKKPMAVLPFCGASLALILLCSHLQQSLSRRSDTKTPAKWLWEWQWRLLASIVWIVISLLIVPHISNVANSTRSWLLSISGLQPNNRDRARARIYSLSLASPPPNLQKLAKPLLAIDAPNAPGYLREAVYHEYKLTSWSGHSTTIQHLIPDETGTETDTIVNDLQTFALGGLESSNNTQSWKIKTLNRFFLTVLCLPGNVTSLMLPEGTKPSINADGMVTLEQSTLPPSYWISVDKTKENQAFPLPEKDNFSDYLQIPANLVPSASNWVQNCQTFAMSESVADGILALENYFHANYTYKLGIQPERGKHPLDNFMQTREGHCTLFASAAALMLRQKNIPSRMVSGYLCQEKHPLTAQWIVRERNTHAWCEAWDQSAKKWRLVEATPPGNLPTGFPEPMLSRLLWEYLKNQGDRFFTYLRTNNPLIALINYIVIGAILIWQFVNSAIGIAIIISTIILAFTLVRYRKYKNKAVLDERVRLREALKQAMFFTEKKVIPSHLRRESYETWSSWWQRIHHEISSDTAARFNSLLEEYQTLRYQAVLDIDGTKKWLDKCKRLITATRKSRDF